MTNLNLNNNPSGAAASAAANNNSSSSNGPGFLRIGRVIGGLALILSGLALGVVAFLLAGPIALIYLLNKTIATLPFANGWLGAALGFLAFPFFLKHGWRLIVPTRATSGPALAITAALVLGSLAVFVYQAGDNFDGNGNSLRYVAATPEGLKFSTHPGRDRVWNIDYLPLTRELVMEIYAQERRPMFQADPERSHWFGATGYPLLWYYRTRDGNWNFFSNPGIDRQTGIKLEPVTRELRTEWESVKARAKTGSPGSPNNSVTY